MAIKLTGDNLQHNDQRIASVSATAMTMDSSIAFSAAKMTASNGLDISNHLLANNGVVTVSGQLTASNGIEVAGDLIVDSDFLPKSDGAYDLGSSTKEWQDLHLDGVAYIDELRADTLGAALDCNNQAMTNVDIDSGAVDGCDVTVGSGKTLNVSAGTLTTSAAQNLAIMQGAGANVDIGGYDLRASTLTADSLTSGRVPFAGTNGVLQDDSDFTFATDTLTVTKIGAFEAAGAINFASQAMTNVDINSGAIDGCTIATSDVTVGADKTLNVSAGTLTTSAAQKLAIVEGVGANADIGGYDLRAQTLTADARTSGSVAVYSTNGLLYEDAGFTYNGASKTLSVTNIVASTGTSAGALAATTMSGSSNLTVKGNFVLAESYGLNASGHLSASAFATNWTNADRTVADLGIVTTVDINGGTIDGATIATSDVTVGSGKTLNVSAGTLTTSAAQNLAIMQGAGANVDIGGYDLRASTLTADSLTSGRVPFAGTNGVLQDDSDFTFATDTLTVTKIGAFEAAGAINFASQAMTNVDINSGAIDGCTIATSDVTVGADKTLNVSAGTLTTSAAQKLAIVEGVGANADIGGYDLRAQTLTADARTSGSVAVYSTNGLLYEDAGFTYNGASKTLSVTNIVASTGTSAGALAATTISGSGNAEIGGTLEVDGRCDFRSGMVMADGQAVHLDSDSDWLTLNTNEATFANDVNVKALSFVTYSDATLKKDIKPLDNALDKVMSMRGVTYEFKNGQSNDGAAHREVGFLAQEMKQTVPEVVYGNGDGNLGIDYAKLTSVLVEAVKAQQGQIEELRAALLKK